MTKQNTRKQSNEQCLRYMINNGCKNQMQGKDAGFEFVIFCLLINDRTEEASKQIIIIWKGKKRWVVGKKREKGVINLHSSVFNLIDARY